MSELYTERTDKLYKVLNDKAMEVFGKYGMSPRFVGGCARDHIIGKSINDIDIATPLTPEHVIEACEKANLSVIPTGIDHGTVTVLIDGESFEVTTLRKDSNCDGRHADVEFTDSWSEDALRRDFTVNAMSMKMYSARQNDSNVVYDYFKGEKDLMKRVIKFVGDPKQRIEEDYLRILRYFRFHGRYGETIDQSSLIACEQLADGLQQISNERIRDEMFKIFEGKDPASILLMMLASGIFEQIFSQPKLGLDIVRELTYIKNNNTTFKEYFCPEMFLAALLDTSFVTQGNAEKAIEDIKEKWKLSNDSVKKLELFLCREWMSGNKDISIKKEARSIGNNFEAVQRMIYEWAYCRYEEAGHYNINFFSEIMLIKNWEIPTMPLKGQDLIDKFDLKPNPLIGIILAKVEEFWEYWGYEHGKEALFEEARRIMNEELGQLQKTL